MANHLEWNRLEAWALGRKRFEVVREKHGWMLYRFIEHFGVIKFKSKESVRDKEHGKRYAENLWRLSGGRSPEP
jgi:hypothetical protein